MRKLKKHFKAFTLVELIIVITIFAILATIAFISFQNYTRDTRDGNRVATLKNIETWLELYTIKTGSYPTPDREITQLLWNWWVIISQKWTLWENISQLIKLNKTLIDPLTNKEYTYSTTWDQKSYQIWTIQETDTISHFPLIQSTYWNTPYKALVKWNYKPWIITAWWYNYFIPSLIFNEWTLTWTEIKLVDNIRKIYLSNIDKTQIENKIYYVLDKEQNLPYQVSKDIQINQTKTQNLTYVKELKRELLEKINQTRQQKSQEPLTQEVIEEQFEELITWTPTTPNSVLQEITTTLKDITTLQTQTQNTQLKSCDWIPHGQIKLFYTTDTVLYLQSCTSETFTCNNGIWNPTEIKSNYPYVSCNPWLPQSCNHLWEEIWHESTMTVYSENNILWNASYDCNDRIWEVTCNNWEISWDTEYQYKQWECVKWTPTNCIADSDYEKDWKIFNVPQLNHSVTANPEPYIDVVENNWTYRYWLTVTCTDWNLDSILWTQILQSCSINYHTEDNTTCISNTKQQQCTQSWKPNNSTYNVLDVDVTWNGTGWNLASNCEWNCDPWYDWINCIPKTKQITQATHNSRIFIFTNFNLAYNTPETKTSQTLTIPNWTSTLKATFTLWSDWTTVNLSSASESVSCNSWYYKNGTNCSTQWSWNTTDWFTFKNTSWTTQYPTSCNNLLTVSTWKNTLIWSPWNWSNFVDWVYYIKPDSSDAFKVYCDMTTDWGGWTFVWKSTWSSNSGTVILNNSSIWDWTNINTTSTVKLDTTSINNILFSGTRKLKVNNNTDGKKRFIEYANNWQTLDFVNNKSYNISITEPYYWKVSPFFTSHPHFILFAWITYDITPYPVWCTYINSSNRINYWIYLNDFSRYLSTCYDWIDWWWWPFIRRIWGFIQDWSHNQIYDYKLFVK